MAIFISLGSNCYVSWTLRRIGVQQATLPFDWINSFRFDKLLKFVDDGDASILGAMQASPFNVDRDQPYRYFLPDYSIRLPHEHEADPSISTEGIIAKYSRRIDRLKECTQAADHVVFVRCVAHRCYDLPPEKPESYTADLLRHAVSVLGRLCTHSRFTLLIASEEAGLPAEPIDQVICSRLDLPFENGFFKLRPNLPLMEDAIDIFRQSFSMMQFDAGTDRNIRALAAPFRIE